MARAILGEFLSQTKSSGCKWIWGYSGRDSNEGGEATYEITFCKLQYMELLDLPNLTSFNSGGCILSFPSLERILVKKCPNMKFFSSGLLNTPKLERVKVGDYEWHWQEDLNTTMKSLSINTHGMH